MEVILVYDVNKFAKKLDKPTKTKFSRAIERLKIYGSRLGMPDSKRISKNLYELRIRGQQEARFFYGFKGNTALVFYGYTKKSQKIPSNVLMTVKQRHKQLEL